MKTTGFTPTQKIALAVFTVIAVLFAAYFFRNFFILIVVAAITAFLFTPLYNRFKRRFSTGLSATFTFFCAFFIVIVPLVAIAALAGSQIASMVGSANSWLKVNDLGLLGDRFLEFVNNILASIPFVNYTLTQDSIMKAIVSLAQNFGNWFLNFLSNSASGFFGALTASIIYIYVFLSLLVNQHKVTEMFRNLNPLGKEMTDMYLAKTAAMVKGTVNGQFIIALCQGLAGAISIYIAGFHEAFFIFFIFLSALSIIPLGSGIVTIPFGIGMALFGNVVGGIFIVIWHMVVITNIDNILRPILVPQKARLDPALMLLSVFAGIGMFGFWGIVIGPVLMILVVSTIKVYLAVYKGIPMDEPSEKPRRNLFRRFKRTEA